MITSVHSWISKSFWNSKSVLSLLISDLPTGTTLSKTKTKIWIFEVVFWLQKWTSICVLEFSKTRNEPGKKTKTPFLFLFLTSLFWYICVFLWSNVDTNTSKTPLDKKIYIHSRRHSLILNNMKYSIICTLKPLRVANILKYRIRRLQKKYFITSLGQILKWLINNLKKHFNAVDAKWSFLIWRNQKCSLNIPIR